MLLKLLNMLLILLKLQHAKTINYSLVNRAKDLNSLFKRESLNGECANSPYPCTNTRLLYLTECLKATEIGGDYITCLTLQQREPPTTLCLRT